MPSLSSLPTPVRAALGLAATVLDEAKSLPDKAIELPMMAVSRALKLSLKAQQHYTALAARGDEVLSGRRIGDEPPEWARFDEVADDPTDGLTYGAIDDVIDDAVDDVPGDLTDDGSDLSFDTATTAVADDPIEPAPPARPAKAVRAPRTKAPSAFDAVADDD